MYTIHKFPIPEIKDEVVLEMPGDPEVLSVQFQNGVLCLWALVDTSVLMQQHKFHIYGTGHPCGHDGLHHIATVQDGPFVWHIFED